VDSCGDGKLIDANYCVDVCSDGKFVDANHSLASCCDGDSPDDDSVCHDLGPSPLTAFLALIAMLNWVLSLPNA